MLSYSLLSSPQQYCSTPNGPERAGRYSCETIPGLDAVEEAVGRATEMGRPVLFIPGIDELDSIDTIAGISILGRVGKKSQLSMILPFRFRCGIRLYWPPDRK